MRQNQVDRQSRKLFKICVDSHKNLLHHLLTLRGKVDLNKVFKEHEVFWISLET